MAVIAATDQQHGNKRNFSYLVKHWVPLFDDDLLGFYNVAIDQAEQIDASSDIDIDVAAAIDTFAFEDLTIDVNHLQCGLALVADGPIAVVIESKGP